MKDDKCIEGKYCINWLSKCKKCIRHPYIKITSDMKDYAVKENQ